MPPQAMRARCSAFRYYPISKGILAPGKDCNWKIRCALQHPLGIVTAKQLNKLEFVILLSAVIYLIVVRVRELSYL